MRFLSFLFLVMGLSNVGLANTSITNQPRPPHEPPRREPPAKPPVDPGMCQSGERRMCQVHLNSNDTVYDLAPDSYLQFTKRIEIPPLQMAIFVQNGQVLYDRVNLDEGQPFCQVRIHQSYYHRHIEPCFKARIKDVWENHPYDYDRQVRVNYAKFSLENNAIFEFLCFNENDGVRLPMTYGDLTAPLKGVAQFVEPLSYPIH